MSSKKNKFVATSEKGKPHLWALIRDYTNSGRKRVTRVVSTYSVIMYSVLGYLGYFFFPLRAFREERIFKTDIKKVSWVFNGLLIRHNYNTTIIWDTQFNQIRKEIPRFVCTLTVISKCRLTILAICWDPWEKLRYPSGSSKKSS